MNRLMKKITLVLSLGTGIISAPAAKAQLAQSTQKTVVWTKVENGAQVQLIREGNHEYILRTPLEIVKQVSDPIVSTYLGVPDHSEEYYVPEIQTDELIRSRLYSLPTSIGLTYNSQVRHQIDRLLGDRRRIEEAIGRSKYFLPIADQALASYPNVPTLLKYLPLIESSYKPKARSRAGASGIWQFMKGTGRMYGLKINGAEDHRLDPEKATKAAVRYLSELNEIYDDWLLALAAYNCGPGRVNRAISYSGLENPSFWDIQTSLPRETRYYIPKFIAAVYIMSYHESIGLTPNWDEYEEVRLQVENIKTNNYQSASSDKTTVKPIPENASVLTYTVKSGDNLGFIAEWYDVSASQLRTWNNISGNLIKPGQKLSVYIPSERAHIYADIDKLSNGKSNRPNSDTEQAKTNAIIALGSNKKYINYTIQSGDTLWDISRKNGVSIDEIKQLNNISNSKNLKPGMVIKILEKS